ncbi:hypothetical protein HaLaN_28051 [Haematococcus lacustris]|uniref:Uncharacterized protein n=1 Tax=Haematococcus lacustris TaxID=44745 RepID=A0A6A0ABH6_HAELA|nr:hypothetical protein HaLaN_28051 [Haematococcus lacustris]
MAVQQAPEVPQDDLLWAPGLHGAHMLCIQPHMPFTAFARHCRPLTVSPNVQARAQPVTDVSL